MVEMGLIQDAVGSDEDMTDVPLRSCWEVFITFTKPWLN